MVEGVAPIQCGSDVLGAEDHPTPDIRAVSDIADACEDSEDTK